MSHYCDTNKHRVIILKNAEIIVCGTAVGTRPWTNRFTSASTTIVSSASQSHMVDPDWIHILGKQRLPCVKVTVYVRCQCSENRCFWRVIDHKYQAPCSVAWCTVYSAAYKHIMYPINSLLGLCRKIVLAVITHFLWDKIK